MLLQLIPGVPFSICALAFNVLSSPVAASSQQDLSYKSDYHRINQALSVLNQLTQFDLLREQSDSVGDLADRLISLDLAPGAGPAPSVETAAADAPPALAVMTRTRGTSLSVTDGPARLRAGPSLSDRVLVLIPEGNRVQLISQSGEWLYISYANYKGFVHASLINVSEGEFYDVTRADSPPAAGSSPQESSGSAQTSQPPEAWLPAETQIEESLDNFVRSFSGSYSFKCLDDLGLCESRHAWLDCQLVMIVCLGEAFMQSKK
jgi:hypothetical protein